MKASLGEAFFDVKSMQICKKMISDYELYRWVCDKYNNSSMRRQMMNDIMKVIDHIGRTEDKLLEILIELQKLSEENYLSEQVIRIVAQALDISMTKVYGIANFYSMLSTIPRGKYVIQICNSAPCHIAGEITVTEILKDILHIDMGETTSDGLFTLEYTSCIGACDQAPAIRINEEIYGLLDRQKIYNLIENLKVVV